jgi:hypothetical protein
MYPPGHTSATGPSIGVASAAASSGAASITRVSGAASWFCTPPPTENEQPPSVSSAVRHIAPPYHAIAAHRGSTTSR